MDTIKVKCRKCWGTGRISYEEMGVYLCDDCLGKKYVEIPKSQLEDYKFKKIDYGLGYRPC